MASGCDSIRVMKFAASATVVVVAGYFVATTAETLAEQTGLGQTIVGATLVAISTSLPEVSTTYNAVRFGAYSMAMSNILGTNALEAALFLPADLAYSQGSIFAALDQASVMLAAVGIVVTLIYLWGVLERADRTVGNFGIDSAFVLATYLLGNGAVRLVDLMSSARLQAPTGAIMVIALPSHLIPGSRRFFTRTRRTWFIFRT